MTRIRSIKPELYRHVELFDAEQASQLPLRLAFTGLFTCCDREGRFRWQAQQLKLDVLPYDSVDFEAVLSALQHYGFISQYSVNGKVYGAIPSWVNHQRPSRDEPVSDIPAPRDNKLAYNQPPTQTLRLQIYARDQYCCLYCQEDLKDKPRSLCLDYVIPLQQGGSHRPLNLATSCKKCSALKANRSPEEADLIWPLGLGEGVDSASDRRMSLANFSGDGGSETENPSLDPPRTGGHLRCDPKLTPRPVITDPPSEAVNVSRTGGPSTGEEGQRLSGVEREGEREKEGEVEREREGEKSKSIVAPVRRCEISLPPILAVFDFWKATLGHPQAVLDDKRKTLIRRALKSGYTPDQLCEAIRGCSLTPYNLGKNDRGQRYDGLHVILKDADQIERFIRNAQSPPRERNAAEALLDSNRAVFQTWLQEKEIPANAEGETYDAAG